MIQRRDEPIVTLDGLNFTQHITALYPTHFQITTSPLGVIQGPCHPKEVLGLSADRCCEDWGSLIFKGAPMSKEDNEREQETKKRNNF